ncbi:hypothetical protein [Streptomyces atriruber]|uniref:hypothetical protein n=1 Tax=Streptomyces atriruber TaxID=545121 RepID=UPI0006E1C0AB|nr:hypothetical protein [Streptomyces atriruber]
MADSDPAVQWWETDPDSPGNLSECDIEYAKPCPDNPGLAYLCVRDGEAGLMVRPMFEVLPQ